MIDIKFKNVKLQVLDEIETQVKNDIIDSIYNQIWLIFNQVTRQVKNQVWWSIYAKIFDEVYLDKLE